MISKRNEDEEPVEELNVTNVRTDDSFRDLLRGDENVPCYEASNKPPTIYYEAEELSDKEDIQEKYVPRVLQTRHII